MSKTLLLPSGPMSVVPGHINVLGDPTLRKALGIVVGIAGGARGVNTEGDIVTQTVDGVDLNGIWAEFQATLQIKNRERQALIDFLTYSVTNPVETVAQFGTGDDFEVASEFGVPKSMRTEANYFQMGFAFEWYDTASRYTWKFLADATAQQVESVHTAILEADNRLMFLEVMRTLFRKANRTADIKGQAYNVYGFYNGDGTVPPDYKATSFDGTHTHYLTSGSANVDSGDLDDMYDHLAHHGYTKSAGVEIVLMVNKAQGDVIRNFRSIANGGTAKFDFIPATNQPSFLLPTTLRTNEAGGGSQPSGNLRGMTVIGSYGDMVIVQEDYIPAGYMVAFGTGGPDNLTNPIGLREHANPALRGLRLVKGRNPDYPLQDAIYQRGFGTGIRQRGAGVVMFLGGDGSSATYAVPAQYA
jgi:hypothetical protein